MMIHPLALKFHLYFQGAFVSLIYCFFNGEVTFQRIIHEIEAQKKTYQIACAETETSPQSAGFGVLRFSVSLMNIHIHLRILCVI